MIRTLLFAMLLPVVATTATQPDGSVILTIQNHAASTMTGYFYKDTGRGFLEMGYKDAALETATDPIPPNQQITQTFPKGEVTLFAALWADGTSYGDPAWIGRLRERRVLAQQHNDAAIYLLQKALDTEMEMPALVKLLHTLADGITSSNINQEDVPMARNY